MKTKISVRTRSGEVFEDVIDKDMQTTTEEIRDQVNLKSSIIINNMIVRETKNKATVVIPWRSVEIILMEEIQEA